MARLNLASRSFPYVLIFRFADFKYLVENYLKLDYTIFSEGDQMVTLQFNGDTIDLHIHQQLMRMKVWLTQNIFAGQLDVILGYRSISIHFDLYKLLSTEACEQAEGYVAERLMNAYRQTQTANSQEVGKHVRIPVCYEEKFGLDLREISIRNRVPISEIVRLHTAKSYNVYLIGFLPGFPYLGFVDEKLAVPRKNSPRSRVPAGSVGVAGKQTGIYPFDSPGGWQIIGRTPLKLFDGGRVPASLVEAGDTVSFYAIDEMEFYTIQNLPG